MSDCFCGKTLRHYDNDRLICDGCGTMFPTYNSMEVKK